MCVGVYVGGSEVRAFKAGGYPACFALVPFCVRKEKERRDETRRDDTREHTRCDFVVYTGGNIVFAVFAVFGSGYCLILRSIYLVYCFGCATCVLWSLCSRRSYCCCSRLFS